MKTPRLIYIAPLRSPFVQKDINYLSPYFNVLYLGFHGSGIFCLFKNLLLQLFQLLWNTPRSSHIVIMFGGYHALLPTCLGRLFRKKVFIILGGTDCVSFPSINYGTFRKPFQGKVACASYRLAYMLLPVHHSLMFREDSYYSVDSSYQGCQFWCKNLQTPFTEIHNGYDSNKWKPDGNGKRPNSFVTIAAIPDQSKLVLKGVDLIIQAARSFPHCTFTIIGLQDSSMKICDEPNITLLPFLPANRLLEILASSRFYLQLSISEGFPNALCEAMLTECVPIGSNVAAIPDIIGETGFILKKRDLCLLQEIISLALLHPDLQTLGEKARKRIVGNFPIENRVNGLLRAMGHVL